MKNVKEIEEQILTFWEENKTYQKVKQKNVGKKKFFFIDGPPYPTGRIHLGTALNKIWKDFLIRYFRMKGFDVHDQAGYDTHGVPIEIKVEKLYNFKTKKDIENFGVEKFIQECKKFATENIEEMNKQFKNLGVWMDFENAYLTLRNEYIENAWYVFSKIYKKGLVYKGLYPVHVCPKCETVVSYNEVEYEDRKDPSIYVRFKVKGKENEYLLIWTTTPWTLVDNVAVMVNPEAYYVKVKVNNEVYIVAEALLQTITEKLKWNNYEILEKFLGKELENLEYEHPFEDLVKLRERYQNIYKVVLSKEYVNLQEGTGLVHSTPSHGFEDYEVGLKYNLPIVNHVNFDGTFNIDFLKGLLIFEANEKIIEILKERNALLKYETIVHAYPKCWRCETPLFINAIEQWFIKVKDFREKLKEENEKIFWKPEFAKYRMRDWINNLSDWPFSRQRYWGIPIPMWICEKCGKVKVLESAKDLNLPDLHKPYIDEVTFTCKCGGTMRRIKDIFDVWFDSGVVPWASMDYLRNKKKIVADLEIEGPDQIRGWWNSQHIISTLAFGKTVFRRIMMHGFVLDAHGRKMSKSLGNIVQPKEVIEKYGRDVLRAYFLIGAPWEDYYFNWEEVEELARKINIIRNVFEFINTYVTDKGEKRGLKIEDKYIISKLNLLLKEIEEENMNFNFFVSNKKIIDFIVEEVSRFYIKLIRDRVWPNYEGKDKLAAFYTLNYIAKKLLVLLAPMMPFLAEYYYQKLKFVKEFESVHLEDYPKYKKSLIKEELIKSVEIARKIAEDVLEARNKANIKIRQPLSEVVIVAKKDEILQAEKAKRIITLLTNVKKVTFTKEFLANEKFEKVETEDYIVYLNKEITKKLKEEGMIREIVRSIQEFRKKENLEVHQKVKIVLNVNNEEIKKLIEKNKSIIEKETNSEIEFGTTEKNKLDFDMAEIFAEIIK